MARLTRMYFVKDNLKLNVESKYFFREIFKCVKKKRRLDHAFWYLEPFRKHWFYLLTAIDYPNRDYQWAMIVQQINSFFKYEGDDWFLINLWVEDVGLDEVKATIDEILLVTIREYMIKARKPYIRSSQFVFCLLFRNELKNRIVSEIRKILEKNNSEIILLSMYEEKIEDEHPQLKKKLLTAWQEYLLYLRKNNFDVLDCARISHIPRETFYYEELKIWELLKNR